MIDAQKMLSKYGVFTSPVSGLKTYLKGTVLQFSKELVEEVLKQAAENVDIDYMLKPYTNNEYDCIVNKQSILNVINQIKWE